MDILTTDHGTAETAKDASYTFSRRQLAAYVQTVRYTLSRMFGEQTAFGGARRYYKVLGYTSEPSVDDYRQRYDRQDIAGRVVDLPAQDSWKKPPQITEDGNEETAFCQAWQELCSIDRLGVWNRLMRVDKLSGIGQFGVLLLGFRDGADNMEEAIRSKLSGPNDVLYLRPFSEESVRIATFDENPQSERFGQPEIYEIKLAEDKDWQRVHWSRILHVAENRQSDEVYGTPRLKRVFNRLDDLIKLVGGTGEANWWAMRPGTMMGLKEGFRQTMTDAEIEEEIEDMTHDPMRIAFMTGIEATQIGTPTILEIKDPFEVCLALIAAASGIPQRVLIGSAQGELAAAREDRLQWAGEIAVRQKTYVEPEILRVFIGRLIDVGVLPGPSSGEYHVGEQGQDGEWHWPSILDLSDLERAEIESQRASAIAALSDVTKSYILSEGERREVVNHPREWPEDEERVEEREPQEPVPPGLPGQEPNLEESENPALQMIARNYADGAITFEQFISNIQVADECPE